MVSLIPASCSLCRGKMEAPALTRSSASRTAVSAPEELKRSEEEVISTTFKSRPRPEPLSLSVLTSHAVDASGVAWQRKKSSTRTSSITAECELVRKSMIPDCILRSPTEYIASWMCQSMIAEANIKSGRRLNRIESPLGIINTN